MDITKMLDEQAMRALRMCLVGRAQMIEKLYPRDGCTVYEKVVPRQQALEDLIHLVHELGLECEGLIYE